MEEQLGKLTAAVSSTLACNNASSLLHDAQRVAAATNFAQGCIKLAGQAWALPAPGAGNPSEQSPGGFSQRAMLRLTAGALRLLMGPGRQLLLHPALHGGVGVAWLPYLLMGQLTVASSALRLLGETCWSSATVTAAARSGSLQAVQLLAASAAAMPRIVPSLRDKTQGASHALLSAWQHWLGCLLR